MTAETVLRVMSPPAWALVRRTLRPLASHAPTRLGSVADFGESLPLDDHGISQYTTFRSHSQEIPGSPLEVGSCGTFLRS